MKTSTQPRHPLIDRHFERPERAVSEFRVQGFRVQSSEVRFRVRGSEFCFRPPLIVIVDLAKRTARQVEDSEQTEYWLRRCSRHNA
jgi:hypothetical protein